MLLHSFEPVLAPIPGPVPFQDKRCLLLLYSGAFYRTNQFLFFHVHSQHRGVFFSCIVQIRPSIYTTHKEDIYIQSSLEHDETYHQCQVELFFHGEMKAVRRIRLNYSYMRISFFHFCSLCFNLVTLFIISLSHRV